MSTNSIAVIRTPALAVGIVYSAGLLQGLTLVSFPASSAVLKQMHGFTDAQYGAIFLPQVVAAVLGSLAGGSCATRWGLKTLLWLALLVNALSQLLLALTAGMPSEAAFGLILAGTACLGFGFGLSGAPLNGLPPLFFPGRPDTAIVALHTLLGLGLALGPWIANPFIMNAIWVGFPLVLAGFATILALAARLERFPQARAGAADADSKAIPMADPMPLPQAPPYTADAHPVQTTSFWLFAVICVLYAFAEGTFSNWAVLYLQDVKQLPPTVAAGALSVFWAAIVGGRLLTSVLVLRVAPQVIWLGLPVAMIAAFELLPYVDTPFLGIACFAFAGLACSAFFPLSIGLASKRFEQHVPWVSSMLIAALMVGVGLGSYVIGALRELIPLEQLYRFSALYPLAALILATLASRKGFSPVTPANRTLSQ
jgi:predicted MFS family arabinose efflux permease